MLNKMDLKTRIKELFCEETTMAPADFGGGSGGGGKSGLHVNLDEKDSARRNKDRRRKMIERKREKMLKGKQKAAEKGEGQPVDPRELLLGEFKLTLKESFVNKLMEYVITRKSAALREAVELMNEYPNLKKYVIEKSQRVLPKKPFCVYACRESSLTVEVGSAGKRSGNGPHLWCLSKHGASQNNNMLESFYIMEARITPNHALLYIPAFTDDMEKLIFSGKIEEPNENVLRNARRQNEVLLPGNINQGLIVEIH